jgi:hypothetical protein
MLMMIDIEGPFSAEAWNQHTGTLADVYKEQSICIAARTWDRNQEVRVSCVAELPSQLYGYQ